MKLRTSAAFMPSRRARLWSSPARSMMTNPRWSPAPTRNPRMPQAPLEALAVVGLLSAGACIRLDGLGVDAGFSGAEALAFIRLALGPVIALGGQDAVAAFEAEADFEFARGALVDRRRQGIRNRLGGFRIDAQREAMLMHAPFLGVAHAEIGQMSRGRGFSDAAHVLRPTVPRSDVRRRAG